MPFCYEAMGSLRGFFVYLANEHNSPVKRAGCLNSLILPYIFLMTIAVSPLISDFFFLLVLNNLFCC